MSQWSLKISHAPCQNKILLIHCGPCAPVPVPFFIKVANDADARPSTKLSSLNSGSCDSKFLIIGAIIKYRTTAMSIPWVRSIMLLRSLLKTRYPIIAGKNTIATSLAPRDPENSKAIRKRINEIPAMYFQTLEKEDK